MERSTFLRKKSLMVALSIALAPCAFAENHDVLVLINHFDKPLKFIVGKNPETLPDLPSTFMLNVDKSIVSRVIDNATRSFVRAEDDAKHCAFFAVHQRDHHLQINGYLATGIAFSWSQGTVTFCTPKMYQEKNSC